MMKLERMTQLATIVKKNLEIRESNGTLMGVNGTRPTGEMLADWHNLEGEEWEFFANAYSTLAYGMLKD